MRGKLIQRWSCTVEILQHIGFIRRPLVSERERETVGDESEREREPESERARRA